MSLAGRAVYHADVAIACEATSISENNSRGALLSMHVEWSWWAKWYEAEGSQLWHTGERVGCSSLCMSTTDPYIIISFERYIPFDE